MLSPAQWLIRQSPPLVPSSVLLQLSVRVAATMKVTSGPALALCSLLLLLLLLQVPDCLGLVPQPRGKGIMDDGHQIRDP